MKTSMWVAVCGLILATALFLYAEDKSCCAKPKDKKECSAEKADGKGCKDGMCAPDKEVKKEKPALKKVVPIIDSATLKALMDSGKSPLLMDCIAEGLPGWVTAGNDVENPKM